MKRKRKKNKRLFKNNACGNMVDLAFLRKFSYPFLWNFFFKNVEIEEGELEKTKETVKAEDTTSNTIIYCEQN